MYVCIETIWKGGEKTLQKKNKTGEDWGKGVEDR
jgi:hypothetical protein